MKKIAIVLFVVATALAACGKKKAPEAPATDTSGSAAEPAAGSADAGSGSAAGSGS